jgi:hypothetical protein
VISWVVIIVLQPIEVLINIINKLSEILDRKIDNANIIGEVTGYQFPNILLIKQEDNENIDFSTPIIVHADDGKLRMAMTMDYIGYSGGRWLRALRLSPEIIDKSIVSITNQTGTYAYEVDPHISEQILGNDFNWKNRTKLIGLVAPKSDIEELVIDVVNANGDIEIGSLLEVKTRNKGIMYQVINGITEEEIIESKNKRGFIHAKAKKIGVWDSKEKQFKHDKWISEPNSPIFLVTDIKQKNDRYAIGYFPGTSYSVKIKNINQLITHNTAILGILGVGKSYLSFELIERIVDEKIKVVCLDITDQYEEKLSELDSLQENSKFLKEIKEKTKNGKSMYAQNVEEGGSINIFRNEINTYLSEFIEKKDKFLLILNPADFEIWRQDSKLYQGIGSMASLSTVEITKIITEELLAILQEKGITDVAKCCLVYEEAHALIPEWNSVISDGDKSATNGIVRTILQGRKYGLGCLVITQRTANVSKSILNQCNSVFAMRIYDSTGMDFLKNYIGREYSQTLSTLEDQHAVFFGRASSCNDPVLIALNNRDDFIKNFRK